MAPVSAEENRKLLVAYCAANSDADVVAKYIKITKNAVIKRYTKLVAAEKEAMEKMGLVVGGSAGKKRAAATNEGGKARKKARMCTEKNKKAEEDHPDKGVKAEYEDDSGNIASDEVEVGSDPD